jgi:hypothetical protein
MQALQHGEGSIVEVEIKQRREGGVDVNGESAQKYGRRG